MRYYSESDINASYMQIRRKALQDQEQKISIDFVFNEFELLKTKCRRIIKNKEDKLL